MKKIFVFILLYGWFAGARGQVTEFPKDEVLTYFAMVASKN